MQKIDTLLADLNNYPAQTPLELDSGFRLRRTQGGVLVVRLHYSAHPDRNPDLHPEWKEQERATYTSQADWDREQEIVDEAGGGELIFADVLAKHWDKIIISNPGWRPDPNWRVLGGFDHGKTNPTVLERAYVDFEGNIIFAGEYYVPGKQVWEHAAVLKDFTDVGRFENCYGDPSVFDQKTQQEKDSKEPKAISQLYEDEGIHFIRRFHGNRNNQTFVQRLLAHWGGLDSGRLPTVRIVCRGYSEPPAQPSPGIYDWDCPNLLWELMRTRRRKLTAQQLMSQNPSEEIIDKDDHARDCLKYVVMSLPEPAKKTAQRLVDEKISSYREAGLDEHSLSIHRARLEMETKNQQKYEGTAIGGRRIPRNFRRT